MELSIVFYIAIVLIIGLVFGQLAAFVKLPSVTGYLVGGLIVGPSVLNGLTPEVLESLDIVEEVALAFIAFTVGLSFKRSYFKRVGIGPVIIALCESVAAVLIVIGGLLLIGVDLAFAIILGAIAAATDPASTIMVIKEFKAKGPVTETLMSVVALDDAMALILFGFASAIARMLVQTQGELSLISSILSPFIDIFFAVLIGAVLGFLMKWPLKFFQTSSNRLVVLISFVFLASGISVYFGVSELLTIMVMGAVLTNISLAATKMNDLADRITTPIYVMFFVVSGAGLDVSVIPTVGFVGLVYIILRVVGKIAGAYLGADLAHTPKTVSRYLGMTLIPQAGVAIGLTAIAESIVPMYAAQIKVVVLCSTLIYALIGPLTTKMALTKAGEIPS
ncbi:transporter, CPA2 family (TC 2.A.37) [Alkalibacterium putridalgicola]|uniref:Potassium transporter n=1 Tax=Alkalibacterium putridalgicola TaxID=426703 RepID=A0A1H7X0X0_9LACT|nr:cation:proton antiporter [Alkalibacterium putridalgicola]GEK90191.1 potassium transporter [Alkalibacterium putridalgicola]SEM27214.1 transporter, CPA2 family (TC 2.A.37) [Alkalibacterium putridalgicola]